MAGHFITTKTEDPFSPSPPFLPTTGGIGDFPIETKAEEKAADEAERRGVCPFCYTKQRLRKGMPCPNARCYSNRRGIPLPPEVFTNELFPVVIVGASSSGKSHFLAALKHRLVNEGFWGDGEGFGYWKWSFVEYCNPANSDDASVDNPYIVYETSLYGRKQTLASTKRDDEHPPLLLSLEYLHHVRRAFDEPRFSKKGLLVAITDTAGEHAQGGSIGAFEENYPVLKQMAKGAIVMLDPKELRNESNESANGVLAWFKRGCRKSRLPMALCVSKIDELVCGDETVPQDWLDEHFNTDLGFPGRLVLPDIENNSKDVFDWMERGPLRATADDLDDSFRYHSFFAISALGVDPFKLDGSGRPFVDRTSGAFLLKGPPQPLRVLDPFLWILWQQGKLGSSLVKTIKEGPLP